MPFTPEPEEPEKEDKQSSKPKKKSRRWWIILLLICLIAIGAYFFILKKKTAEKEAQKPVAPGIPVMAVAAVKKDVNVHITGLGSVTALNTVLVRSRVDGQLMEVLFKEGQNVKSGDLLARIDPRPFEVQLTQAEGQLARDLALLKNAQLDLQRYQTLWEQDSVSKQQLDTQDYLVRQYEGAVKTDQGQIDNARLQLTYCEITAPLTGRVGLRLVDPGNIVHAADTTGMLVIAQFQPITVIFPIPEDYLPEVLARTKTGQSLAVEAFDRDMKRRLAGGSLMSVDNQIDTTTGTVRLKALFQNEEQQLFPNQFVNARLVVDVRRNVVVVPAPAIQRGPQGTFVYVVKPDNTAGLRPVSVGEIEGGEALIKTGISAGELVVVEGAEKLREGLRIEVRTGGPEQSPGQSAGQSPGSAGKGR